MVTVEVVELTKSGYGEQYASVYPDHPGIDKIYSLLMAAQLNGSRVAIYLTDENCKVGEMVLGAVCLGVLQKVLIASA